MASDALAPLEEWFDKRVGSIVRFKEYTAEIKTGAEGKLGIPLLASLFAALTTAFKTNATYKDEIRREIRNTFAEFAKAFNSMLRQAELALNHQQKARRVLFVVDGTDKLRWEDQKSFFVHDGEQLLAIDAHVIYSAPLSLKYEGNLLGKLDADLVLPMIKLYESDGGRCEAGWLALTRILLLRAARALFASEAEINKIVEHCGGHPRELLRLLKLCCEFQETGTINAATVDLAIKQLASEYRRFLEPDDYAMLAKIDRDTAHGGNDERTRKLLYNLALLEYNDGGWQRSHPVVKLLDGYRRAAALLSANPGA